MLVLTRKGSQSIMIGDDIEVSVLSVVGEKVRIGISAPRDVPVFRKEVYIEIQAERDGPAAAEGAIADPREKRDLSARADAREERDAALRRLAG